MSYLDEIFQLQELYSLDATLLTLSVEYFPNQKTLHLFIEDEDDFDFYHSYAVRIYNDYDIYKYPQKGKQNVIDAYRSIDWSKYNTARVLFFCDKDYDDILQINPLVEPNIFYTSHYSIENYMVTDEVYSIILSHFFENVPKKLAANVIKELKPLYKLFINRLTTVTGWILTYRLHKQTCDLDKIVFQDIFYHHKTQLSCLKNVSPTKFNNVMSDPNASVFEKGRIRKQDLRTILEGKTKASPQHFDQAAIKQNIKQLKSNIEVKQFIRGKYEFWFIFRVFFPYFTELANRYNDNARANNTNPKKTTSIAEIKRKIEIKENTIFCTVPPKMKIPEDIDIFLRRNYAVA